MNLRYFLIPIVAWACGPNSLAQTCAKNEDALKAEIQQEAKLPSSFTLRASEVPSLEEATLSIQVDGADSKTPKVQEVKFCEFVPFMFQLQNGTITATSVELDSESAWLIGLGPKDERYLLTGFSDPLPGFNALVKTLGLKAENEETAKSVFDLYLRLVEGRKIRESVIVDDMQLQSLGLSDFRMRYSLPKARVMYVKWWGGISPGIKKQLRKPEVMPYQNGFRVSYFRYGQGRIMRESLTISKEGMITVGVRKALYAPVMSASDTVDAATGNLRMTIAVVATTMKPRH